MDSTAVDGKTGLHLAALHDYTEVADLLIKWGISLTAQDTGHKMNDSDEVNGVRIFIVASMMYFTIIIPLCCRGTQPCI